MNTVLYIPHLKFSLGNLAQPSPHIRHFTGRNPLDPNTNNPNINGNSTRETMYEPIFRYKDISLCQNWLWGKSVQILYKWVKDCTFPARCKRRRSIGKAAMMKKEQNKWYKSLKNGRNIWNVFVAPILSQPPVAPTLTLT